MKLDSFVRQLDSATLLIEYLNRDKSGDIYLLPELVDKVPGLKISSSTLRHSRNNNLKKYVVVVKTNRGTKAFYGNPAVIARASKYAAETI